jgi:hypothetical protein
LEDPTTRVEKYDRNFEEFEVNLEVFPEGWEFTRTVASKADGLVGW